MQSHPPDWVKHAVFYQIFPDRFARSDRISHPPGMRFQHWGSVPTHHGFQGGDLLGVVDRLDHLSDLGINAIYLNPIFASASNHRYHTFDYYQVDTLLGGNAALRELLDAAHRRDMRIILDGVFNHASRGFWAFHHLLETGGESPYRDWFQVKDWPLRPYHSSKRNPPNYECWWDLPALPKFNTENRAVRQYLLDVAKYWIDFGIDGWRLDVPQEIDHRTFWQDFRRVVKSANPDAYLVGEIWHMAPEWVSGDRFDALMNYPLGEAALCFFGGKSLKRGVQIEEHKLKSLDGRAFSNRISAILDAYPPAANAVQLNLLDSHDMPRALWILSDDKQALRQCVLFLMTMPGAPCIYYGDEIGMTGGADPDCRRAFPWGDSRKWDLDLLAFYRRAIALRHRFTALRTGSCRLLHADRHTVAFLRSEGGELLLAAFNSAGKPAEVTLSLKDPVTRPATVQDVWHRNRSPQQLAAGQPLTLRIPAQDAVIVEVRPAP